jgi:hypothetical protein
MPDAQRTRSLACKVKNARKQVTTGTPDSPAFPARWVTAYPALSPVSGLDSHRRSVKRLTKLDSSVGESGPRGFAVRPSALVSHARPSIASRFQRP